MKNRVFFPKPKESKDVQKQLDYGSISSKTLRLVLSDKKSIWELLRIEPGSLTSKEFGLTIAPWPLCLLNHFSTQTRCSI